MALAIVDEFHLGCRQFCLFFISFVSFAKLKFILACWALHAHSDTRLSFVIEIIGELIIGSFGNLVVTF